MDILQKIDAYLNEGGFKDAVIKTVKALKDPTGTVAWKAKISSVINGALNKLENTGGLKYNERQSRDDYIYLTDGKGLICIIVREKTSAKTKLTGSLSIQLDNRVYAVRALEIMLEKNDFNVEKTVNQIYNKVHSQLTSGIR